MIIDNNNLSLLEIILNKFRWKILKINCYLKKNKYLIVIFEIFLDVLRFKLIDFNNIIHNFNIFIND